MLDEKRGSEWSCQAKRRDIMDYKIEYQAQLLIVLFLTQHFTQKT